MTGFSFYFVEYYSDVYAWALNRPVSSQTSVVSLSVLKANPDIPLVTSPNDPPIRVFADKNWMSSGLCRYWDRFSAVAGGGWTGAGVVNDGTGCLVQEWGDIALFVDGTSVAPNVTGVANPETDLFGTPAQQLDFLIVSVYCMIVILLGLLALWGYRVDVTSVNAPKSVHLDGDGVTTPLSLDDPIAYHRRDDGVGIFVFHTFLQVLRRVHVVAAPFMAHPVYTRAQRVLTGTVVITSCMATVSIFLVPGEEVPDIGSVGFVASLISAPIMYLFEFMLAHRPDTANAASIKRNAPTRLQDIPAPMTLPRRLRVDDDNLPPAPPTPRSGDMRHGLMPIGPPSRFGSPIRSPREIVPPPPPEEDAPGFIRRVQHVYTEKATVELRKEVVVEGKPQKPVPLWVESVSAAVMYSAVIGWLVVASVVVGLRTSHYDSTAMRQAWAVSAFIALVSSVLLLEPLRCGILTIIELRKYEIRRRKSPLKPRRVVSPARPMSPVPLTPQLPEPIRSREPSLPPPFPPSSSRASSRTPPLLNRDGDLLPGRIDQRVISNEPPTPPPRPPATPPPSYMR